VLRGNLVERRAKRPIAAEYEPNFRKLEFAEGSRQLDGTLLRLELSDEQIDNLMVGDPERPSPDASLGLPLVRRSREPRTVDRMRASEQSVLRNTESPVIGKVTAADIEKGGG
jgi:hypothetical protein